MFKIFLYPCIVFSVFGWANSSAHSCKAVPLDENKTHLEQLINSCAEALKRGGEDAVTTYRLGYAFEKRGDYQSAVKWLKKSALLGSPLAYRDLAGMVERGEGVKRDPDLALMLYLIAIRPDNERYLKTSEEGNKNDAIKVIPELQSRVTQWPLLELSQKNSRHVFVHLGYAYPTGSYDVGKSEGKAFYWFMQAAEKNDSYAKTELAKLCLAGIGLKEECEKVFDWNLELAHQSEPRAQYLTGVRYHKGVGVAKDEERALWWLTHSADQNNSDARNMLKLIQSPNDKESSEKKSQ
jgi:TPR repeat protein